MLFNRLNAWLMVVVAISGMGIGSAFAADTIPDIVDIHVGARLVVDEGPIMRVDHAKGQIIINEISHFVGQFFANEKVYTTRLTDAKGDKVDLHGFEKGQWVVVSGFRVARSKIYLESVRTVNGTIRKIQHTISRVKTKDTR